MPIQDAINTLLYDQPNAATLKEMLLVDDIALSYEVFEFIDRQLNQAHLSLDDTKSLIELLPNDIYDYPPATQLLLTRVFLKTKTTVSKLPDIDTEKLPPTVASEWLKTEALLKSPQTYAESLCENALLHNETNYSSKSPIEDLEALCSGGLISTELTRTLLLQLLQSTQGDVVRAAIKSLGKPWSVALPCPEAELLALLGDGNVAELVLTTLSKWKSVDFLIEFASGDHNRYQILHVLGLIDTPLDGPQITALLDIAMSDAYFFAPTVVRVLRNQHRRRHNFSKSHIENLFQLLVLAPNIDIESLSEIVRPSEKRWLRLLEDLHPQNRSWKRHIQLLQRINTPQGNVFLFTRLSDLGFEALHGEMIVALGRNGYSEVEKQGLALLEKGQIEQALAVISDVGGVLSKQCLWDHIDDSKAISGLSKTEALNCVLSIEENIPDVLNQIPTALLSSIQLPLLGATASTEVTDLLLSILETGSPLEKLQAIKQLGNLGGATCLEPLAAQLLLFEADDLTTIHNAIQQIGKRLYECGSLRPQVVRTAKSAQQAGEQVLADCILTLCERSELNDEPLIGLMETMSELQCHHADKRVLPYLNHKNPHVQKLAITCLCHNGCAHLSDKLRHFLHDENIYTRRAAIIGFAKLQATWFDAEIAESLNHPNMNIKKAAAEALASIGTPRTVPLMIKWIARHDNQGLRERLVEAMSRIVGDDYVPLVLTHLSQASDSKFAAQEQLNLLLALTNKLSARAVVIAYQDNAVWAKPLTTLINSGEYQLKGSKGSSHLHFEAWRLGITLPTETQDSPAPKQVIDTDRWLNCLINNDSDVDNRDITRWVDLEDSLSKAQTIRLIRQLPKLLSQLNSPQYGEASLKVLSLLSEDFSQGQKTLLSTALLQQLQQARLTLESLLQLLKRCDAILPNDVAVQALNTSSLELQKWGLAALINTRALDKPLALTLLNTKHNALHPPLISYFLERQWHQDILSAAVKMEGSAVEALQAQWCNISNSETVECLIKAFPLASDSTTGALLEWASTLQGDKIDRLLLNHLGSSVYRYRETAINALSLRPSAGLKTTLSGLLTHESADLRQAAAIVLLAWPGDEYIVGIVKRYLQGNIRYIGHPYLSADVFEHLTDLDLDNAAKQKHINLICHSTLSAYEQIEHLWPFLDDQEAEVRTMAEAAIRGLPAQSVLDYLWPELEAGKWGYLTLLQRSHVQRELIEWLETGNQETQQALLDYFLSLPNPIRGEGLLTALLSIQSPLLTDHIIQLIGKLSDWEQPKQRGQLLDLIKNHMANGGDQAFAIDALKLGIERLTIPDQLAAIQSLLTEQNQTQLLPEWVERCLLVPSSIHNLPEQWQSAVAMQLIELSQDRDEEKARGALRLIVDGDIESSLDVLDDALHHPKSRVRAYAHRLLRKVASKEHYLESTLTLLTDKELALRCSAIRTLAFRGYLPAVKGIAEQLYVKKRNVNQVARASLMAMGKMALPGLKHAASHSRPDQRALLVELIEEIEGHDYPCSLQR